MTSQKDNAELIAWLESDEKRSREWRAFRLAHLLETIQIPEEGAYFQGEISLQIFNELRLAYIHGLYLATVLLSLAYVEQELSGRLYAAGWEGAKKERLEIILDKAYEYGILSEAELNTFQNLRSTRNAYAHFRRPGSSSSMLFRSVEHDELPYELMKADAHKAIESLGTIIGRFFG